LENFYSCDLGLVDCGRYLDANTLEYLVMKRSPQ